MNLTNNIIMTEKQSQACTQQVYQVSKSDLPISCPTDDMILWNAHPKVYLPLSEENPAAHCPYCGVKFTLQAD